MGHLIEISKANRVTWAAKLVGLKRKYTAEVKKQFDQSEWEAWLVKEYGLELVYNSGGICGVKFTDEESQFIFSLKW